MQTTFFSQAKQQHQTYQIIINGTPRIEQKAQLARKSFRFFSESQFVYFGEDKEAVQSVAMIRKSDGKIIEAFQKAACRQQEGK